MDPKAEELDELLNEEGMAGVEWGGRTVIRLLATRSLGQHFSVQVTSSGRALPQGIVIKTDEGFFSCVTTFTNAYVDKAASLGLWETGPDHLYEVTVTSDKEDPEIEVWNIWEDPDSGSVDAWLGGSGMVVEELPDGGVVLHCTSGVGGVDFEELRAELIPTSPDIEQPTKPSKLA